MSYELASESGPIDQFASGKGYADLIHAIGSSKYPALRSLVVHGATEHVSACISELGRLSHVLGENNDSGVVTTAKGLARLMHGLDIAIITDGTDVDSGTRNEEKTHSGGQFRKAATLLPLQRGGPTVDRARRHFQAKLVEFLRDVANKIARRVLLSESGEKVAKADPAHHFTPAQPAAMRAMEAEVLHINWEDLVPEAEAALTTIAEAGGYQALAQLEIRDTDVISEVNSVAGKWAHERAAEMVGRKWVDGKLVENPNAKWAISETTRTDLRSIVEDAFQHNTSMRELSSAIQEAGAFSEARAMMIAKTEAASAEHNGNLAGWRQGGVESVNWTMSDDHDDSLDCDCPDNEDGSPYPLDEVPSYPCHPLCMCSLSVDRLTGEPSEDDEE